MNFIKKIADGHFDNEAHLQMQKFSRGEFKNKALIEVKNSNGRYTISTGPEFANDLVKTVAEKLDELKTEVTGAIISTLDLDKELDFKSKKQFMGVKQYIIEKEMSGKEIANLLEKFPKAFFALSFNSERGDILKTKVKAPKSAKPKTKEETPKADFCKLTTKDERIAKDFVWEKDNFKEAEISHDFIIEEIKIPEELKKEKDFAKIRELSKRKGKIIRKGEIDSQPFKKEIKFEA